MVQYEFRRSDRVVSLPAVRRFEAAGFRAWPAELVEYDGSWQRRLAPGHPTRRPNCVVPLDPGDTRDIAERVERAQERYSLAGVPLVIKETPLCPTELVDWLSANGWMSEAESSVQAVQLDDHDLPAGMDIIPSHDMDVFVDACLQVEPDARMPPEAMKRLFGALEPETGMFILGDSNAKAQAVTLCVHDGDLAGLQQVAVAQDNRGMGLGFKIVGAALRWAKLRGATRAWLQVEVSNDAGNALYRKFGFSEVYRYRYWRRGSPS